MGRIREFLHFLLAIVFISAAIPASAINDEDYGTKNVQQAGDCTGVVKDAAGETIIGASVLVKGTTNGTITGIDGDFTLKDVKKGSTLQISYVGYHPMEVVWDGKPLDIILQEDTQTLDEVVVTAMGIKKDAKKLGYAVSTVNSNELVKTGASNFASAMYGKASGVRIQAAPGGGTSSVSISVRGLSSITGSTQPLIIMDGVPIHNGDANNNDYWSNQRVQSNGLVDINPEDIESISILKGAAASALYGSEAANGVVMITTKSGKGTNGVNIEFGANITMDKVAYMPEIQKKYGPGFDNAYIGVIGNDYEKQTGGFINTRTNYDGQTVKSLRNTVYNWGPAYDGSEVYYFDNTMRPYNPIPGDPWSKIFRTGWNQNYNIAISTATERGNIRFAYTYTDNQTTQLKSDNSKHNFALNGSINITKDIKLDYSANYMRQQVNNRTYRISRLVNNFSGMFGGFTDIEYMRKHTITSMGYLNVIHGDETPTPNEDFAYGCFGSYSGLVKEYFWNILGRNQDETNQRFISAITPSWQIIQGLSLRGRLATDLTARNTESKYSTEKPNAYLSRGNYTGYYALENYKYEIYYGDIMLLFDRTFNEKYNFTANVGWSGRQERAYSTTVNTNGGLSVENWFNLSASSNKADASMYKSSLLKTAIFATLSFGYDSWGYLEGTVRQEKTSTLAPGRNSFFYPSINGSIIFSELMKERRPNWVDYGKFRISYGIVGNAPGLYEATQGYQQSNIAGYIYNIISTNLGNDLIKPEKKYEFELGLEGKFFRNRLGAEISFYSNNVKNQIIRTTTAASSGGQSILLNVGELQNKGLEISLNGTPISNKKWNWNIGFNIAFNSNKVKSLKYGLDRIEHMTIDNGAAVLESHVGESMGDWYVYGIKRNANGEKMVDSYGLYIVDYTKRVKAGNAMPKATGGFNSSLSYKNFNLDFTIDFRLGGYVFNQPYQYMMAAGNIVESMKGRDPANGGLTYYCDDNDPTVPSKRHLINQAPGTTYNGNTVYGNGVIQPGVLEDGSPNNIIATAGETGYNQYGWGYSGNITYENSIQKNTYFKMRELTIGYVFPENITKKFACKRLMVSVFGRNLFYFYKSLKAFDSEATDGTSWIYQSVIGGSTATTRTFGVSLRANF